jgi:hypothetical protein
MLGCIDPIAANYDGAATDPDQSCIYTMSKDGKCLWFRELFQEAEIRDENLTLSFSVIENNWVFFHDYAPDFYVHTREKLYSLKDRGVYVTNEGPKGNYYGVVKPFFVDVAIPFGGEMSLSAVHWLSEAADDKTISHITVWNRFQCTGRIPLATYEGVIPGNHRYTKGSWSIADLRDISITDDFLDTLFNNFAVKTSALNSNLPWYEQALIEDNYVLIRLEFDNSVSEDFRLHDVQADSQKTGR